MDRPRLIRGLRIAVSAVCGILCVLLIALWVRSYWWLDMAGNGSYQFGSLKGAIYLALPAQPGSQSWQFQHYSHHEMRKAGAVIVPGGKFGFDFQHTQRSTSIQVPYWLLVFVALVSASIPWFNWKFSLRTLLIATTIVALLLGLVVYMAR